MINLGQLSLDSSLGRVTLGTVVTGLSGQASVLLSGVLAARILGVEGRGHFALLVLFPTILFILGGMGLPQAVVYYISEKADQAGVIKDRIWRMFPFQAVMLIAFHLIILSFFSFAQHSSVRYAVYFTLFVSPAMLAQQYGQAFLQGIGSFKKFNLIRIIV